MQKQYAAKNQVPQRIKGAHQIFIFKAVNFSLPAQGEKLDIYRG